MYLFQEEDHVIFLKLGLDLTRLINCLIRADSYSFMIWHLYSDPRAWKFCKPEGARVSEIKLHISAHILFIYYIFDGYDVGLCTSLYTAALFTSFMYLDLI